MDIKARIPLVRSSEATHLLFGDARHVLYYDWLARVNQPSMEQYYDNGDQWLDVMAAVEKITVGDFPSVDVYNGFMHYLLRTDQLYPLKADDEQTQVPSSRVALKCHHTLHPGDEREQVSYCPVCTMERIVASLRNLWMDWNLLGGSLRQKRKALPDKKSRRLWKAIKDIWQVEKHRWATSVFDFQGIAEAEIAWENAHHSDAGALENLDKIKSSQMALRIAWEQCPGLPDGVFAPYTWKGGSKKSDIAEEKDLNGTSKVASSSSGTEPSADDSASTAVALSDSEELGVSSQTLPVRPAILPKKGVTFASSTMENPSRDSLTFYRLHESYTPGRWAAATLEYEVANTSFYTDTEYWARCKEEEVEPDKTTTHNTPESIRLSLESKRSVQGSDEMMEDDDSDSDTESYESESPDTSIMADEATKYRNDDGFPELNFPDHGEFGDWPSTAAGNNFGPGVHEQFDSDNPSYGDCGDDIATGDLSRIDPVLLMEDSQRRSRGSFEQDASFDNIDRPPTEIKRVRLTGRGRLRMAFAAECARRDVDS